MTYIKLANDSFVLQMNVIKHDGYRQTYAYKLYDYTVDQKPLFEGNDFSSPAGHSDTSKAYSLLGFLSMRPGETDGEYFEDYSRRQLDWTESDRCDDLQMIVFEYEENEQND